VDVAELCDRARNEIDELGPEPANPHDRATWHTERYDAAVRLVALADYDGELLRRAANSEWVSIAARELLFDAAQECR
jgi:hypothetical protein